MRLADTRLRSDLLEQQTKKSLNEDKIPLVLSHSRALPNIPKIIKQNHIVLKNVPEIRD